MLERWSSDYKFERFLLGVCVAIEEPSVYVLRTSSRKT